MISGSESSRESKIEGRGRERKEEGTLEEPERCSLTTVFGEHQRERSGRQRQLDSLGPVCPTPPCKVASGRPWPLALALQGPVVQRLDNASTRYPADK